MTSHLGSLLPIRPIWATDAAVDLSTSPEIQRLLELEFRASDQMTRTIEAAKEAFDLERVAPVESLFESARFDLIAGTELARAGYFKQTYALWRSWYEQVFFALYFIEAPLYRVAWRRSPTLEPGSEPRFKLMLHNVLQSGSTPHPFALVYGERFEALFDALRTTPPKKKAPLTVAEHRLRDLSQAVHGTYQPAPAWTATEAPKLLGQHILPLFDLVIVTLGFFMFVCVQSQYEFSDSQLIQFKNKGFSGSGIGEGVITPLLPQLWSWLDFMKGS